MLSAPCAALSGSSYRSEPQSNCSHIPGSGTHGRNVRRRPARHAVFAADTARRVVRSVPVNPIATNRRWITSARILPCDASTSSSTFGKNTSINLGRTAATSGSAPPSRNFTYRATVFGSQPANCPADHTHRVRSYASKISTISLPDLVTVSPVTGWFKVSNPSQPDRRDPLFTS